MKVIFIYNQFLDKYGKEREIGGIETYLWNLSKICIELGVEAILVQGADKAFCKSYEHMVIYGVDTNHLTLRDSRLLLFRKASTIFDQSNDILIFGADHCSVPINNNRIISIQHGIHWDIPLDMLSNRKICKVYPGKLYVKFLILKGAINNFNNCYNRVCVDYNFLNWYRALSVIQPAGRIWIVPNFATIDPKGIEFKMSENNNMVRIIFARRFVEERGTKLMAKVALRLLAKYKNVYFSFAGSGPDEKCLSDCFRNIPRVSFIRYLPDEVQNVLRDHDIAVIPSLGSEGTSLSVAEAMGAGLAVVASAVGGITNMVLDGFNGLLAMPTEEQFFTKLEELILDKELRDFLGRNAYESVKAAFSSTRWTNSWKNILSIVAAG